MTPKVISMALSLGPEKHFRNSTNIKLVRAILLGEKRRLSKKIRKAYKELRLYHLFTPSGLHLTAFLLPLRFLYRFSFKFIFFEFIILALLLLIPLPLFSLKRMAIFRLIARGLRLSGFKTSWEVPFVLTFVIDYIFGSYSQSPHSFPYSFLFLGVILTLKDESALKLFLGLLGGNLIVSAINLETLHLPHLIAGYFLTSFFTFIFPIIMANVLSFGITQNYACEFLIHTFNSLVIFAYEWMSVIPKWNLSIFALFPLILFLLDRKMKLALVTSILFSVSPIYNLPLKNFKISPRWAKVSRVKKQITAINWNGPNFKVTYNDGLICRGKMYPSGIYKKCRIDR